MIRNFSAKPQKKAASRYFGTGAFFTVVYAGIAYLSLLAFEGVEMWIAVAISGGGALFSLSTAIYAKASRILIEGGKLTFYRPPMLSKRIDLSRVLSFSMDGWTQNIQAQIGSLPELLQALNDSGARMKVRFNMENGTSEKIVYFFENMPEFVQLLQDGGIPWTNQLLSERIAREQAEYGGLSMEEAVEKKLRETGEQPELLAVCNAKPLHKLCYALAYGAAAAIGVWMMLYYTTGFLQRFLLALIVISCITGLLNSLRDRVEVYNIGLIRRAAKKINPENIARWQDVTRAIMKKSKSGTVTYLSVLSDIGPWKEFDWHYTDIEKLLSVAEQNNVHFEQVIE